MDESGTDPVEASRAAMDRLSIGSSDDLEDDWESEDWEEDGEHPPPSPMPEAELRDWAELPRGVLSEIFHKVGAMDVMLGAQSVCRSWRELSWEPQTWRVVDMMALPREMDRFQAVEMAKAVIDRSNGLMEELHVYSFGDDDLMKFVSERTNHLKCLRLKSCYNISDEALIEVARKFPELEYVEVSICSISQQFVEALGQLCPQLKRLRFNQEWFKYNSYSDDDEEPNDVDNSEAFAIANNMQELQHLQIFGNTITNDGLNAILDKCHKLESLDVRRCYNLCFDERLRKKCAGIRDVRLPDEEISDCEFAADDYDYDAYPDMDFLYDHDDLDDYYESDDEYY